MQGKSIDPAAADPGTRAGAIDGVGWGTFFIWVGVCLLADPGWPAFFMGTGVLMVTGQAARWGFGVQVDRLAVLLGSGLALAGLAHLLELRWPGSGLPGSTAAVLLIAIGVAVVIQAWRRGR